jgi:hypothetical protein
MTVTDHFNCHLHEYTCKFCTRVSKTGGLFNNLNVCNCFNVRTAVFLAFPQPFGHRNIFYYGTRPLIIIISEVFFFISFR